MADSSLQSKCEKKEEEKQKAINQAMPFHLHFLKKERNGSAIFFFPGSIKSVNSHHLCRTIPVRLHGETLKMH